MPAPRPLPVTPPGLLDDEDPGKWEKLKQVLWESNLNAPVRGVYNLMNTPYDVLMGGQSPEFDQAVADSFDAAGGISVGSAVAPKPSNALNMGIKAYHGSPHSFDKFSMDKIGTGEGAQAYGHGLYFAENEGVARGYRDALTNRNVPQGKHIEKVAFNVVRNAPDRTDAELAPFVRNVYPDATDAEVSDALKVARANQQSGSMYEVEINADPNAFLDWDKPLSEQPEVAKRLGYSTRNSDAIHDEADALFTEYGPYESMPDDIKARIEALQVELDSRVPNMTGQQYYSGNWDSDYLHSTLRGEKFTREQSDELARKGIPGIKYLDAGSRGMNPPTVKPKDGKFEVYWGNDPRPVDTFPTKEAAEAAAREIDGRSRNYVVFDDSLIDIIKKYGIAGLLGGGGLYGMSGDEAQAGAY